MFALEDESVAVPLQRDWSEPKTVSLKRDRPAQNGHGPELETKPRRLGTKIP